MRRVIAILFAFLVPGLAHAGTTVSTDYTDQWWNPGESGWGANLTQQGDVLFITLFHYDPNRAPKWFVAPNTGLVSSSGDQATFTGTLYETTGPWFGQGGFDQSTVTTRVVGTFTFTAASSWTGEVQYTIDGVGGKHFVERQTWRTPPLTGTYFGATAYNTSQCAGNAGTYFESPVTLTITQQDNNVQIRENGNGYTCNINATYTQNGRIGRMLGTRACPDGTRTFTATEVMRERHYLAMQIKVQQTAGDCLYTGHMGGMRRLNSDF